MIMVDAGFTSVPFFSLETQFPRWEALLKEGSLPALTSDIELTLSHALLSLVGMVVFPIMAAVQGGAIGFTLGLSSLFFLRKFMLIQEDIRSFKQKVISSNCFFRITAGIFSSVEIRSLIPQPPTQMPSSVAMMRVPVHYPPPPPNQDFHTQGTL